MSDPLNKEPSSVEEASKCEPIDENKTKEDDDELDALLDDALEGFDKPIVTSKPNDEVKAETVKSDPINLDWSEEFMQQASQEFEKSIRSMMAESGSEVNSEFTESLIRASQEAASKVFEEQNDAGVSFAETLRSLAEGAESLQTENDEAALAKMLEKMAFGTEDGLGGGSADDLGGIGGIGEILPAMQGMLQSLLSKELLYPSIKEIVNKYPDWLADNRSKLEAKEYDKYNRQFSVMQKVCIEFENEKDSDDSVTKNRRFEKILALMQEMQECGHPPKELAGETDLPNPLAGGAFPGAPGAENCVIM